MAKKEDNLHLFTSEQNREEAAKNGRKGGIASGEARRRKKEVSKAVAEFMESKDLNESLTRLEKMIVVLYAKAMDKDDKQCISAMRLLFELTDSLKSEDEKKRLKLANKLTEAEIEKIKKQTENLEW